MQSHVIYMMEVGATESRSLLEEQMACSLLECKIL